MDPQVNVNFTCQRCDQPIHLDQGFSHLSEITLAELALPIHSGQEVDFGPQKLDKIINPFNLSEVSGQAHGFTVVRNPTENQKLSPLKTKSKLFDMLSTNSDIDHPLCEECTDNMLDNVDDYISRKSLQIQHYERLYTSKKDAIRDDTNELEEVFALLQKERDRLLEELSEMRRGQVEANNIVNKRREEKNRLEEEGISYWRIFCDYKCQLIALEDENRSLKSRRTYMQEQLDQLEQVNALNLTFRIWFNTYIGTINGLHLGRLKTIPVSWPEINAAWGQTTLLLSALARKADFKFSKYKLVPHGNTSYIEVVGDKKEQLPLYGSGGIRFIWDSKFDNAMVAFLRCVDEFQRYIESTKFQDSKDSRNKFCLPYRINDHCLENSKAKGESYSIKMQFNSEECWTKALKFMLINLKWSLTWVTTATDPPFSSTSPSLGH
ncbi:UNVERIFIED_CONTAM: hypothetical protein RMT77_001359 [Armadillidium vulgare]